MTPYSKLSEKKKELVGLLHKALTICDNEKLYFSLARDGWIDWNTSYTGPILTFQALKELGRMEK